MSQLWRKIDVVSETRKHTLVSMNYRGKCGAPEGVAQGEPPGRVRISVVGVVVTSFQRRNLIIWISYKNLGNVCGTEVRDDEH